MVKLKEFLPLMKTVIESDICALYEEYVDEYFGTTTKRVKFGTTDFIGSISNLDNFLNYEVLDFTQEYNYGELDVQYLYIREPEVDETEDWVKVSDKLPDDNTYKYVTVETQCSFGKARRVRRLYYSSLHNYWVDADDDIETDPVIAWKDITPPARYEENK